MDGAKLPAGNRAAYVGTASIEDIDTAKTILLIGTKPAYRGTGAECPSAQGMEPRRDHRPDRRTGRSTYDYKHMGSDRAALVNLVDRVTEAPDTLVIVGGELLGADGEAVLSQAMAYATALAPSCWFSAHRCGPWGRWTSAARRKVAKAATEGAEVIYNLGADEVDIDAGAFVIYQGSHGDRGAHQPTSFCRVLPTPRRTACS